MLTLFSILAVWGIVSSTPFSKESMVNTMTMCNDTLYVGGHPAKTLQRFIVAPDGKINSLDRSEPLTGTSFLIKDIKVRGEYVYLCARNNGYGLGVDKRHPDFMTPFENKLGFETEEVTGAAEYSSVEDPCPSRFCKSLRITKGKNGSCFFSHAVGEAENEAEFILWLKMAENPSGEVSIPLIKNVLAISVNSGKGLGLAVNGKTCKKEYRWNGNWINVKVTASGGKVVLSVRDVTCPDVWEEVCSAPVGDFKYDSICCGLEGKASAEIQIDEYAYSVKELEKKSFINGNLIVLDRKTLKLVRKYNLDLRCLSLVVDGDMMYLGMIGGINVYDLKDPSKPALKSVFRDADGRMWTYPSSKVKAKYAYKVPGQEYQRMDIMSLPDGRRILVGGCDVEGIAMVDVTNPSKPTLFKHIDTIPTTPVKDGKKDSKMYIEWAVNCEYPYIYSTVASLHSLVHNKYYDGYSTPESWTPDIYGLKIYDISDLNSIKETIVNVPSEYFPTHIAKDADSFPNQITRIGNKMFLNFGDKGIAVFNANGLSSTFDTMLEVPEGNRVRSTCAFGERLVSGGGAIFGPWTERNIYLWSK